MVFGLFGDDCVVRGEGVKKGKGRVKAELFDSEVREMTKGNAVLVLRCAKYIISFNWRDRSLASNCRFCNTNNRLAVPCIIESDNALQC